MALGFVPPLFFSRNTNFSVGRQVARRPVSRTVAVVDLPGLEPSRFLASATGPGVSTTLQTADVQSIPTTPFIGTVAASAKIPRPDANPVVTVVFSGITRRTYSTHHADCRGFSNEKAYEREVAKPETTKKPGWA